MNDKQLLTKARHQKAIPFLQAPKVVNLFIFLMVLLTPSPSASHGATSLILSQTPMPSSTTLDLDQTETLQTLPPDEEPGSPGESLWAFLIIGMGSGLGILGLASFLLSKSFFR